MNHHSKGRTELIFCLTALAVLFVSLHYLVSCGGGGSTAADAPSTPATPAFPSITLTSVVSGFDEPVHITNAGDGTGRLFIVEKRGVIKIVRSGSVMTTPFLDIRGLVNSSGSEQGLLSVVFPPGFAAKLHFYVDYTNKTGVGDTVVARHSVTANPDIASSTGAETILNVTQPFSNHNGGLLAFGPDGFLYVAMGDGGSSGDPNNNAQNLSSVLGKILRIDVESGVSPYAIPASNPFFNDPSARGEIWAYGVRNPWRFSFDRATGDMYIADVGQNQFEEVNLQPAANGGGRNYGWNIMEGLHCFSSQTCNQTGLTLPVVEYSHQAGDCSITGGFVYRGTEYPALQGIYFYGDFCTGKIWGLRRNGAEWESHLFLDTELQISTFGEDEAGNLYVADFDAGSIYKIDVP